MAQINNVFFLILFRQTNFNTSGIKSTEKVRPASLNTLVQAKKMEGENGKLCENNFFYLPVVVPARMFVALPFKQWGCMLGPTSLSK